MTFLRRGLVVLGAAALVGCEIPTDVPRLEQRWIVPLNNSSISVESFLPDGVSLAGDLFAISVEPFTAEATLGELCAACASGGAVPAFQETFSGSTTYPVDVSSAVLESGAVAVAIQNGFSFDPTAGGGSVVITVSDGPGGKVLGQATISSGMAPGATVTRGVTLTGGSVAPILMVTAAVTSAGGQAGSVDTDAKLLMSVEVTSLEAGFVTVDVADRTVVAEPIELDVEDIDDTVTDRVQSGTLILDVTNPFGVSLTMDLAIDFPGGTIRQTAEIASDARSTLSISYSADELRSFLGKEGVTFSAEGSVSGAVDEILVRTDQSVSLDASLDLILIIG